jgi:hypothetical protein
VIELVQINIPVYVTCKVVFNYEPQEQSNLH